MNQQITLQISDSVWHYAKAVASQNKQKIEEVLSSWLEKVSSEVDIESLSDAEVLALAKLKMPSKQQKILHDLIRKNNTNQITDTERKQLDSMMEIYEAATLRKAQALSAAVRRGLMKPLSSE